MSKPLTDGINALTRYANSVTGASDTTLSEAVATLANGYGQSGGGDEWQLLEDYTLESEGLLQVAVTNISVKQIKVIMIQPKSYSSTAIVYAPINNHEGNHYDKNYGRMMIGLSNSTASAEKIYNMWSEPCLVDRLFIFNSVLANVGTSNTISQKIDWNITNAKAGQEITSVSVATYVSIPAGLRVLVFGK